MTTQTDTYRIHIDLDAAGMNQAAEAMVRAAQAAKRLERSYRDVSASVEGLDALRGALRRLFDELGGKVEIVGETARALQRLARVAASADATMRKSAAKVRDAAQAHDTLRASANGTARAIESVTDEARQESASLGGWTSGALTATEVNSALELGKKALEIAIRAVTAAIAAGRLALTAWSESTVEGAQAAEAYQVALDTMRGSLGQTMAGTQLAADATAVLERALASAEPAGRAAAEAIDLVWMAMREIAAIYGEVVLGLDSTADASDAAAMAMADLADVLAQVTDSIRILREVFGPILRLSYQVTTALNPMVQMFRAWNNAIGAVTWALGGLGEAMGIIGEQTQAEQTAARFRDAVAQAAEPIAITAARANELRGIVDRTAEGMAAWVLRGWEPATQAAEEAAPAVEEVARSARTAGRALQAATQAAEEYVFTLEEIAAADAAFAATKDQGDDEISGIMRAADTQRKYLEAELEMQQERAKALAAAEAERMAAAEQAAAEHAERIRQTYLTAASAATEPLLALYGAGIEAAVDSSAERIGVASRRIIGQQIQSLGRAAIAAGTVAVIGDPAAGFLPNPGRGAALIAAGTAAVGVGTALGASARGGGGGGGGGRAPGPEPAAAQPAPARNVTNIVNMGGLTTDPRGTAREIQRVLAAAAQQGAT